MAEAISSATSALFQDVQTGNKSATKSLGKDEFMKLLTFQLKSQNPMKPMENQEFASQLAQFSQLEKTSEMAELLKQQVQSNSMLTQAVGNTALPALIGKNAKAMSDKFSFDGEKSPQIGFELPLKADTVKVEIKSESGVVVRTIEMKAVKNGETAVSWDGKDDKGKVVPKGNYSFQVAAKDAEGKDLDSSNYVKGNISAVRFRPEGAMLLLNGIEVPISSISDVTA